jgi:hypothetical protein
MKILKIIQFLFSYRGILDALYETIDYLVKRNKLKNDDNGLTAEDKNELKEELWDIANAFLKITKKEKK